jgi:hypothetical protein
MIWIARLHWVHPERAPAMGAYRYSSNPSVIRGHERGIVPLAGWLTALSLGMLLAPTGVEPLVMTSAVLILGSFLLLIAHATIAWFNWPKVLVPPHRRREVGSVVEWFRERKQRRTAAGRGSRRRAEP